MWEEGDCMQRAVAVLVVRHAERGDVDLKGPGRDSQLLGCLLKLV